jgi:hypothetical protein
MGLGFLAINTVLALLPFAGLAWLYQFRLFDIPVVWWSWVLLLFAEDFCYYWFHRLHHEVRTLWAAHINHHSSTRYNFSTALRQSWTTPFTGFIFWIPLPLLGFPVEMILIQKSISLLYQYWLHTELIGKLGWFGVVFNTPSHPVRIAFHEWSSMLGDAWNAKSWRGRLGYLVMRPGWTEDGTGKTSTVLRREYLAAGIASAPTAGT